MGRRKKADIEAEALAKDQAVSPVEENPVNEEKPKTERKKSYTYAVALKDPKSFLNLRSGASKNSDSIGQIPEGTILTTLDGSDSEWKEVEYDGKKGYVLSSRLKAV